MVLHDMTGGRSAESWIWCLCVYVSVTWLLPSRGHRPRPRHRPRAPRCLCSTPDYNHKPPTVMATHGPINGVKISRMFFSLLFPPQSRVLPAIDDPRKVVKVIASDGKDGETKEISYNSCKVVGNGSFGVVFQAKLLPSEQDIAIKKVLQDKRFKVCPGSMTDPLPLEQLIFYSYPAEPRAPDHETSLSP